MSSEALLAMPIATIDSADPEYVSMKLLQGCCLVRTFSGNMAKLLRSSNQQEKHQKMQRTECSTKYQTGPRAAFSGLCLACSCCSEGKQVSTTGRNLGERKGSKETPPSPNFTSDCVCIPVHHWQSHQTEPPTAPGCWGSPCCTRAQTLAPQTQPNCCCRW